MAKASFSSLFRPERLKAGLRKVGAFFTDRKEVWMGLGLCLGGIGLVSEASHLFLNSATLVPMIAETTGLLAGQVSTALSTSSLIMGIGGLCAGVYGASKMDNAPKPPSSPDEGQTPKVLSPHEQAMAVWRASRLREEPQQTPAVTEASHAKAMTSEIPQAGAKRRTYRAPPTPPSVSGKASPTQSMKPEDEPARTQPRRPDDSAPHDVAMPFDITGLDL